MRGYDSGGWLPQGLSLAMNNTGRPGTSRRRRRRTSTSTLNAPGYVR